MIKPIAGFPAPTGVATTDAANDSRPASLVANTVNVYWVPLVSPVIVLDAVVEVSSAPPRLGDTAMRYVTIGEPPLLVGAAHVSETEESVALATSDETAPGGPTGVPSSANDSSLSPRRLLATTRNEYGVPLVSPVTLYEVTMPTSVDRLRVSPRYTFTL